ncbi:MAG: glycosyltransferase [Muribaculaceae bacterium]|nr:glycosyltransferase [Roseburia sp.]MCM1429856.1 glycosyltransferase [Muribaculaceae bacterium]MCM1492907.1 glycosyltransferase [Muribaculaceae bacterium]
MKELILSICMPVYNGGDRLIANIKKILHSQDQRFELVICDNGSTDGAIESLQEMQDNRLQIYVNEKNLGPLENGLRVLERGNGKYLMQLLDRDILQTEYLSAYIDMLETQTAGVILNLYVHAGLGDNWSLNRTEEAVFWILESPHPSFYVFLREAFQEMSITDWMKSEGYYSACCGLMILKHYAVIMQREYPIVLEAEKEYIYMHSSRSHIFLHAKEIDVVKSGSGFDQDSVFIRFQNYISFVKKQMKPVDRGILLGIYRANLKSVSPGYFSIIRSCLHCHRYSIPDKKYASWEYKKLPFWFYRRAKLAIKSEGMWSLPLQWKMWWTTWRCRQKFCREICN